jgi:hypothetical protein
VADVCIGRIVDYTSISGGVIGLGTTISQRITDISSSFEHEHEDEREK